MNSPFIAKPPKSLQWRAIPKHLWHMLRRIAYIIWQIIVPFNSRPEEIASFPEPDATINVSASHVEQSQWIFDQAEERRDQLEQKAQSTFGLMIFLVPFLASIFVFILSKGTTSSAFSITVALVGASAVFLLLAFISAVRAVAVKNTETLFVHSVVNEEGQFRKYSEAFRARGLLYCASMNTAINDHIAQFVKGAHLLTAAAVLALLMAAIPTSIMFLRTPASPVDTKIVGVVNVSSLELSALRDDVASLRNDIQKLSNDRVSEDDVKLLEAKVAKLDAKLSALQKALRVNPPRKALPPLGHGASDH